MSWHVNCHFYHPVSGKGRLNDICWPFLLPVTSFNKAPALCFTEGVGDTPHYRTTCGVVKGSVNGTGLGYVVRRTQRIKWWVVSRKFVAPISMKELTFDISMIRLMNTLNILRGVFLQACSGAMYRSEILPVLEILPAEWTPISTVTLSNPSPPLI